MTPKQISTLWTLLFIIIVVALIMVIVFIAWRIIEIPIKGKAEIFKERDEAKKELLQIQAAKGVEWDKYKEQTDELDRVRVALIKEKETHEKLKEDNAKLKVHNDNLKAINNEHKKQTKTA